MAVHLSCMDGQEVQQAHAYAHTCMPPAVRICVPHVRAHISNVAYPT